MRQLPSVRVSVFVATRAGGRKYVLLLAPTKSLTYRNVKVVTKRNVKFEDICHRNIASVYFGDCVVCVLLLFLRKQEVRSSSEGGQLDSDWSQITVTVEQRERLEPAIKSRVLAFDF